MGQQVIQFLPSGDKTGQCCKEAKIPGIRVDEST